MKSLDAALQDGRIENRRVLLRLDLNIDDQNPADIQRDYRVETALPVIRRLVAAKAKLILLVHRGRPKGFDASLTNAPIAQALSAALQHPVRYVAAITGTVAEAAVAEMAPGDIVLLENLRFDERENKNDTVFAAALAQLGDTYINDAFANCHRKHASIEAITHHLPSYAGPLLLAETAALHKAFDHPARPLAAIIGGAKISTKLALLENIITKVDILLVGGAMANTFLAAEGIDVQKSFYEPDLVPTASTILAKSHTHNCQLVLPFDVMVATSMDAATGKSVPVTQIPSGHMVLDIGPATTLHTEGLLANCRTVLWNGPVGLFENPAFAHGTLAIARCIAAHTKKGLMTSIAGGGDTVSALNAAGVMPDFSYVSTAGGAFLEYLEGKTLPGLAALERSQQ